MQDPLRPAQQIGFAREVEPQQPVPLQRQARRTERIGTRRDVAVGQEPTTARTAHGAFAAAPHVEKARDRHRPPCKALQEGPRHMVERPTDQPLHSPVIFFTSDSAFKSRLRQKAMSVVARLTSAASASTDISSLRNLARMASISAIASS